MKFAILIGALVLTSSAHARTVEDVVGRPLKCGDTILKFKAGGDQVLFDGELLPVEVSDGGSDANFDGHSFSFENLTLDQVRCDVFTTRW